MAYINGTRIMSAQLNGLVAIDEELSAGSTNPVQNKAVGNALANALKGTVTGMGAVRMDDVSPVEHEIALRLASDTITDFSDVTVTGCGKNLFDKENAANLLDGYVSGAGVYTVSFAGEKSFVFKCTPNTDYVVSKRWGATNRIAGFSAIPTITTAGTFIGEYNDRTSYSFNSGTAEYIVVWYFNNSGEKYTNEEMLASIQLEYGTTATVYEPYMGAEYTANADGTVNGVLSVSPMTTLTADTDSVVVTATYNKDVNVVINTLEERLAALEATTSI